MPSSPIIALDASEASAPRLRGWGRYVAELAAALGRRPPDGLEMRFLTEQPRGPELLWEQLALPRLLRRERAAAVHSPNCFLPLRRPCPGVVTVHDLAFEDHPEDFSRRTGWKYRTFAPRAVRSAERVICVSAFTRDDVCRRYGIDPGKVRVIHPAPALPVTTHDPPEGPYVLAVGDVRRKKNLVRLVESFRSLHDAGIPHRLVVAGADSGEAARLRESAGTAPVELTGYVPDPELDALMRGADLLVHPSLYEGFGLVLVEAMARGVPVAAARATALPETAGDAALLFDPLDVADMSRVMASLIDDGALRDRLAQRGRERAAGFTWDRTAAATAAVYRELVA